MEMAKPALSQNALAVLERRYLQKNEKGEVIETPKGMFKRVAKNIAAVDKQYDSKADLKALEKEFYNLMVNLEFLPNSPTLMNAGRDLQQLSACFVLSIDDSMESIFETNKNAALIHKSGGGTGFSFSRLRPKSDTVKTTGGVASGPVSFMKIFNASTEAIKQGGTRRGANMGILRVDHPDIKEFIHCKDDKKELNNFNISVAVTDEFMNCMQNNEPYALINPKNKRKVNELDAKELFDEIVEMAWRTGDPGIIFLDEINRHNPTPNAGEIESTNPCGEQPLLPYESCNLGSINLSNMVKDKDLDWEKLERVVKSSAHFLDNVIDANQYPLKIIAENTKANRKIGLGVMGWADVLLQLGIPYNSDEALELAEKVMKFITDKGREMSIELGKQRGSFPNFKGSVLEKNYKTMRNATVTTIAPTGTISMISDVSSGIEPLFAISYIKRVMDGTELVYGNKHFETEAKKKGIFNEKLMKEISKTGSIMKNSQIPESMKRVYVTAHDIEPEWHVKMQAAFQKYTDNAVSKTVNFPEDATVQEVKDVYMMAYETKCKGITIFRDKCREEQVINIGTNQTKDSVPQPAPVQIMHKVMPRARPTSLRGTTMKQRTGCGNLYITINEDESGVFEVFARLGKTGGCASSQTEAISRLISLSLRSGIDYNSILEQLKGIRCSSPIVGIGSVVLSCPDAIAKALEKYIKAKSEEKEVKFEEPAKLEEFSEPSPGSMGGLCPECGSKLIYEEGCSKCLSCDYTKCG